MTTSKVNVIWAVLIAGVLAGFFLGQYRGKNQSVVNIADNPEIIRQISELAVLEVTGNTKLTVTNTSISKSIWNDISDFFGERTLFLEVPYTAKYGVDLAKSDINVKADKKSIVITLEKPALQSMEMRLDKMQNFSKTGLFVLESDDKLKLPLQKLYAETKKKLTADKKNISDSKLKVEEELAKFYSNLNIEIKIKWEN